MRNSTQSKPDDTHAEILIAIIASMGSMFLLGILWCFCKRCSGSKKTGAAENGLLLHSTRTKNQQPADAYVTVRTFDSTEANRISL